MPFDIYQLDEADEYDEEAFEKYQDALLEQFFASPEGQARFQEDPEMGFWAAQFLHFGYNYVGVTLPQMRQRHVEEIMEDLFPRKVSLLSPDNADDAIPELLAFWEFLKREYKLPQADEIMEYLREIAPEFKGMMNDPSRFGMAKSFFMMGQAAGFDMTTQEGAEAFMNWYNAMVMMQEEMARQRDRPATRKRRKAKKKRKPTKVARKKGKKKR